MMNEQDKAAFEAWWQEFISIHDEWRFADSDALRKQAWQAALEYARGKQEPVACATQSDLVQLANGRIFANIYSPNSFQGEEGEVLLYTHPPATVRLDEDDIDALWEAHLEGNRNKGFNPHRFYEQCMDALECKRGCM